MMAACAGAEEVVACDANPTVPAAASEPCDGFVIIMMWTGCMPKISVSKGRNPADYGRSRFPASPKDANVHPVSGVI
jgi:hypothetical protein